MMTSKQWAGTLPTHSRHQEDPCKAAGPDNVPRCHGMIWSSFRCPYRHLSACGLPQGHQDHPDEGQQSKCVGLKIKFFFILHVLLEFWPLKTVSLLHAHWKSVKLCQKSLLCLQTTSNKHLHQQIPLSVIPMPKKWTVHRWQPAGSNNSSHHEVLQDAHMKLGNFLLSWQLQDWPESTSQGQIEGEKWCHTLKDKGPTAGFLMTSWLADIVFSFLLLQGVAHFHK